MPCISLAMRVTSPLNRSKITLNASTVNQLVNGDQLAVGLPPRLEPCFMISGNGGPAASDRDEGTPDRDDRQLRDIQDLIAKLEQINRQLSGPMPKLRTVR